MRTNKVERSVRIEWGARRIDGMEPLHGLQAIIFLNSFQLGQGERADQWVQDASACGRPLLGTRIVGGKDSVPGRWPWMVSIHNMGKHICGGTLISRVWVLTAAHCVNPLKVEAYDLYFGRYQQGGFNKNEAYARPSYMVHHEEYVTYHDEYDIALINLDRSIKYTLYIQPVCLPSYTFQITCGAKCWVTGWGDIDEYASLAAPGTLQEVEVGLMRRRICHQLYQQGIRADAQRIKVGETLLCASVPGGRMDACQGDSGGPLVHLYNGVWVLVGIVSFAESCGLPLRPGIYTDVAAFQKWISQKVARLYYVNPTVVSKKALDGCLSRACPGGMRGLPHHVGSLVSFLLCVILLTQ